MINVSRKPSIRSKPNTRFSCKTLCFALLAPFAAAVAAAPAQALQIDVTYGAGVSAQAETAFNQLVSLYDAEFTNPITVNLQFNFGTTGLGGSSTFRVEVPYTTWANAMAANAAANPQNPYVAAAATSLPGADPIGNGQVLVRTANARALGITQAQVTQFNVNPTFDSTITLNKNQTYEFNSVATAGAFDFKDVAAHELNEALGIGSTLTNLANNSAIPREFEPEDYFRYGCGTTSRDITTAPNASVCFSYNGGATDVAKFNQNNNAGGNSAADRNDWIYGNSCPPAQAPGPFVQDAVGCPGEVAPLLSSNAPEFEVLASLGFDPVPEPVSLALLATSLLGFGLLRRRFR